MTTETLDQSLTRLQATALQVKAERDALLDALLKLQSWGELTLPGADARCHKGICSQDECGHCGRIATALAAIDKAVNHG